MASGCASSSASLDPIAATSPSAYRLGAGDEIRVTVYGLDTLTNTYAVSDTGTVSMPLLAPIQVQGRTVDEAAAAIADGIRAKELVNAPSVSAQVIKYRPFFILGEVQRPGQYPYVPGMSVLTAVTIAGGYTFRAEKKSASITRSGAKGRADPATAIQPGDTVQINESWF
jgi:polysaccharide export outer membrane protein